MRAIEYQGENLDYVNKSNKNSKIMLINNKKIDLNLILYRKKQSCGL